MTPELSYRYRAFGLLIKSEIALGPGAAVCDEEGTADVHVRLARGEPALTAQKQMTWDGCCRLSLLPAGVLVVEPDLTATAEDLALAVSGSGLALVLEQRGQLVLHGSCIAIDGQGVCLLGTSGVGKSTLAAALQAAGHTLISDAMTAVVLDAQGPALALPGWPILKLWPNALTELGLEAQRRGPVHRASDKQLCAPDGLFAARPTPVRWFVAVSPGEPLGLQRLAPGEGVMTLLRNVYLLDDTPTSEHPELLHQAARAAQCAGAAQLRRGQDLSRLGESVACIEEWVRSAPGAGAAIGDPRVAD